MGQDSDHSITQLLVQWSGGQQGALAQLTALLYQELRVLAQRHLHRERPDHTIQRTALVHEAFLRLVNQHSVDWHSRAQFFALASSIMRRILVDHARARLSTKRGGGAAVLSLDEIEERNESDDTFPTGTSSHEAQAPTQAAEAGDITEIDAALNRLAAIDIRQAKVVEMRYFGGLTIEETAQALGVSDATVKREWTLARAWLRREMDRSP